MVKLLKISFLLLFLTSSVNAQEINKTKIDLDLNQANFQEFSQKLKSGYGIHVYYLPEWVEKIKVTSTGPAELEELLNQILTPYKINFTIKGSQVFLTGSEKITDPLEAINQAVLLSQSNNADQQ